MRLFLASARAKNGTIMARHQRLDKLALDDTVEASAIDVDVTGSVATLTGRVANEAAHTRAVQLARETEGVTSVVDRLTR
jgi:osmotically-inducible protein OsmY